MLKNNTLDVLEDYIRFLLESENFFESSGAGAAMGFSAPLGAIPVRPPRKINRSGKNKKKNRK